MVFHYKCSCGYKSEADTREKLAYIANKHLDEKHPVNDWGVIIESK